MKASGTQTNHSAKKLLATAIAALLLSSCATLDSGSSASNNTRGSNAPSQAMPTGSAQQSAIEVLEGTDDSERQALIAEINRDGQAFQIQGVGDTGPQAVNASGEDVVELNYEQADLRLVLEELAQALDITMIIDPTISRQISMRTAANRPLQRDDIWPLIRLLTRDAGVLVEQVGNAYNVRAVDISLAPEITTPDQLDSTNGARVIQITPLTYVSSEAVLQAIEPMLQPDGGVNRLGNRNLLVLTGSEYQLSRVNQLLDLLIKRLGRQIRCLDFQLVSCHGILLKLLCQMLHNIFEAFRNLFFLNMISLFHHHSTVHTNRFHQVISASKNPGIQHLLRTFTGQNRMIFVQANKGCRRADVQTSRDTGTQRPLPTFQGTGKNLLSIRAFPICNQCSLQLLQTLAIFQDAAFLGERYIDIAVGSDTKTTILRQESPDRKKAVSQIGFRHRA